MRPLLVALAGGGASWLLTVLVLGSSTLASVAGDITRVFAVPIAQMAAAGAAFLAAGAVAWYTGATRGDLRTVLAYLLIVDVVVVIGSLVVVGALEVIRAFAVFVVVSAWGLHFLAVALAVRVAAGARERGRA